MFGKRIECNFYNGYSGEMGSKFSETYIKGDKVKIYGKVKLMLDS